MLLGNKFSDVWKYFFGHYDYNHSGSSQAITGDSSWYRLNNDSAGSFTSDANKPTGDDARYNPTTNQFDFTELNIGDLVTIRFDVIYTIGSANTKVGARMNMAVGDANNYQVAIRPAASFPNVGAEPLTSSVDITMDNQFTIDNPAQVEIYATSNITAQVIGWKVFITKRGL